MTNLLSITVPLVPLVAYGQAEPYGPGPAATQPIPTLMFFTLGVGLAIGIVLLASFLRRRSNRDAMRSLNDD